MRKLVAVGALVVFLSACGDNTGGSDGFVSPDLSGTGTDGPVPTQPSAAVAPTMVDFGKSGCGAAAPAAQQVKLTNSGTAALTFSANVTGPGFQATPASGSVDPGQSTMINVAAAAVPSTATAGSTLSAQLTITTNDTSHPTLSVPLSITPAGGYLTVSPTPVSFGLIPVGSTSPDTVVMLTNGGNQAVSLTFAQPMDKQFSVAWTGAPAAVVVMPGQSVPGLVARFSATNITPSMSMAPLVTTDAICNTGGTPSATAIQMTGQGTNGAIALSTTRVSFGTGGNVPCGTTAAQQTFQISNNGNQAFSWVGSLVKGTSSPFTLAPSSGTIPKGAKVTLTVTPLSGIPATADTTTDAFGDAIQIVTDIAGDSPHTVTLHQTAFGAVLAFNPTSADFGNVPVQTTSDTPFAVVNSGSAPANVTLASDNAKFTVNPVGPTIVDAATSGSETATFAPGSSVTAQSANISVTVDAATVLCAPLPPALTLKGQGTSGSVSFSPAALDFGLVACGSTATAKTITFKNPGNQDYTITPMLALGASSPYTFSMNPAGGVVAMGGGMVVITVTPNKVPQTSAVTPDLYADTLVVSTTVSGDSPHDIPLHETAAGSIFAISTNNLDFGTVVVGTTGNSTFTVSNSGNALGTVKFTPTNSVFSIPSASVGAKATFSDIASLTPNMAGPVSDTATVSVDAMTVLCQPLPFTSMPLKGTGSSANVIVVSTGSLTFGSGGLVDCGSTAAAQTFTISNSSAQTLTMTYTLAGGASSPYTVSGPATLAPSGQAGASGTVTVTPKAIPSTSSTSPDAFADSLKINGSGGPINEDHSVSLHETAQGAILAFNPTSLSFSAISGTTGGSAQKSFTINNSGNIAAPYTLTVGGTNPSYFSVSPTSGSAAASGGSVSGQATFTVPGLDLKAGTKTASVTTMSSVKQCAPLPTLMLSGTEN